MICLLQERRSICNLVLLSCIVIAYNCGQVQLQNIVSDHNGRQFGSVQNGQWNRKETTTINNEPPSRTNVNFKRKPEGSVVFLRKNENFTSIEIPAGLNFKREQLPIFKKNAYELDYPPVPPEPSTPSFLSRFSSNVASNKPFWPPNRMNTVKTILVTAKLPTQLQDGSTDSIIEHTDYSNRTKVGLQYQTNYELDYDQPAVLPPSLPNLEIISFVASDALDKPADKNENNEKDEFVNDSAPPFIEMPIYPLPKFSPPAKTEGGFMPRDPFNEQEIPFIMTEDHRHQTFTTTRTSTESSTPLSNSTNITSTPTFEEPIVSTEATKKVFSSTIKITENPQPSKESSKLTTTTEKLHLNTYTSKTTIKSVSSTEKSNVVDEPDTSFLLNDLLTYIFDEHPKDKDEDATTTKNHLSNHKTTVNTTIVSTNYTEPTTSKIITLKLEPAQTAEVQNLDTRNISISIDEKFTTTEENILSLSDADEFDFVYNMTNSIRRQDNSVGANIEVSTNQSPILRNEFTNKITKNVTPHIPHFFADGLLKLSGCNILGKTYTIGDVIVELSEACSQCMCTEIGVHCSPVPCASHKSRIRT